MEGSKWVALFAVAAGCATAGCAVPQRPGNGTILYLTEDTTKAKYYLYLPSEYMRQNGQKPGGGRWPLVMTFHGLRPYDDANPQVREWQEEADRYGFIVCAPELMTCDTLVTVPPLRTADRPSVRRDEQAILAIMDDVCRRTQADPTRVLATSFSSGGYLAHYIVNRHPERFSCIAVRQSNFSAEMLDPRQVPKYRDMKVGIFFGEHDFAICREESTEAVAWYRQHRFDVTAKYVSGLGHERTPQTAAAYFAEVIGVEPRTPPPLGSLVMHDVMPEGPASSAPPKLARIPEARSPARAPVAAERTQPRSGTNAIFPATRPAGEPAHATELAMAKPRAAAPVPPPPVLNSGPPPQKYAPTYKPVPPAPRRTPPRSVPLRSSNSAETSTAEVRLSTTVGVTPLWISYRVELPESIRKGCSVLWTDNGKPISTALSGYAVMRDVGEHRLEALVITPDDRELRVGETVTVLPKLTSRPVAKQQ